MSTIVGIANTALKRLGDDTITSFTQTPATKSSNAVNDFYTETRDDLLRSHNWNFATKRIKLARESVAPAFRYDHAYRLPADWIRTVSVHNNDAGTGVIEFKEENQDNQNVLVSSADDIYLRYIARITDPNRMPADFQRSLSRLLAAAMAIDLTSSNTVRREVEEEAAGLVRRAKSTDSMGPTPEQRPRGSWANSRGGFANRTDPFAS